MATVFFKKLHTMSTIPTRAHDNDAGLDLYADLDYPGFEEIYPGQTKVIGTGIQIALDSEVKEIDGEKFVAVGKVCSRSGLAAKSSISVLNAPGIIDAGYRGEIKVILHNHSNEMFRVHHGSKIAQLLIEEVLIPEVREVQEFIGDTARGEKGFGSTDAPANS